MCNEIYTLDRLVETVWSDKILYDSILELELMLGEHSDPILGLGFSTACAADSVSCFEVCESNTGTDEAMRPTRDVVSINTMDKMARTTHPLNPVTRTSPLDMVC